jgi:predicted Zn-dependent peptidase
MIVMLAAALGSPALAAKKTKKQKEKATPAGQMIPAHPTELQYGPLDFEVPEGARYRHELSNGIVVYVAEDHALPLASVTITLRAGAFLDPADKPGLASETGSMIRRGGAGSMSAEEFDERVEFLAANMSSSGGDLSSGASFNCITNVLDETLELFFQMLKSPGFQQDRIDVERENIVEEMKQRNDSPRSISGREWGWLMRGRDHYLSRAMTKDELHAVTRDDMIAFHRNYWRPENMIVGVSGDVDPEAVLAKLEKHFAEWKSEGPDVPWPPPAPTHVPTPGVYHVDKDIPQGRVLIGHLGYQRPNWEDPEVFSLMVMNDILGGGGFTSRMVKRIRSDEGLAYSAGSSFGIGQYWPGVFQVYYQSKSETVAFAAKIAMEEIERVRTESVSEEELTVAKNSFIDVFPRRFESASQIVGTFVDDEYTGRPHDYWIKYRDLVRVVSAEDVMNAAKKHLHPDNLVMLIVGKWDEIEPGDADGRASMAEFYEGQTTVLPLRDPLTLEPME